MNTFDQASFAVMVMRRIYPCDQDDPATGSVERWTCAPAAGAIGSVPNTGHETWVGLRIELR